MRNCPAALALFPAILVAAAIGEPCMAADGDLRPSHVRSSDRQVVETLHNGYDLSPTFRRLVDDLEASDVIVYVEPITSLPKQLDGHIRFAAATAANRYLRITVSAKLRGDAFLAIVGHELHHAGEVARSREVRDDASFEALYRAIGDANDEGWDTDAACGIGETVRSELRRARLAHHDQ